MKRVFMAALCCAAFIAFAHGRVEARTDFCPAQLRIAAVGADADQILGSKAAALYGFELTARGGRTVWGTMAFDTDRGWYIAQVPHALLSAKLRHASTPYVTFTREDFVSKRMYVRFPQDVRILNSWLYQAASSGDGAGEDSNGSGSCMPGMRSNPNAKPLPKAKRLITDDSADEDRLTEAPDGTSAVLDAKASPPLFSVNCPEPFKDASAISPKAPNWPLGYRTSTTTSSIAAVTINADGSVREAWIDAPSGVQAFDDLTLDAARTSTYTAARAYCQNVPATYLFNVTWSPN